MTFVVKDAGEKSPENENETTGLLKPPDARGNIPRSPSSEAVEKVRANVRLPAYCRYRLEVHEKI